MLYCPLFRLATICNNDDNGNHHHHHYMCYCYYH